jgi:hypothetical protein
LIFGKKIYFPIFTKGRGSLRGLSKRWEEVFELLGRSF